jgi:hypothetical protein
MRVLLIILTLAATQCAPIASANGGEDAAATSPADPVITAELERFVAAASQSGYIPVFKSTMENDPRGNFDINADNDVYVYGACGENCKSMTLSVYSKTYQKEIRPQDETNDPKKNFINFGTSADARFSSGATAHCIDPARPCVVRYMVYRKAAPKPDEEGAATSEADKDDDGW